MAALVYMDGGDLRSYLLKVDPKPAAPVLINVCWQIANALGYLKAR